MCFEKCLKRFLKISLKNEPDCNLLQKPLHPPSRSTFQAVASWTFANDDSNKKNKMDLVKSNSQVVPIQGGFLTLLITSSFSSIYMYCACVRVRVRVRVSACMCVCVYMCAHPACLKSALIYSVLLPPIILPPFPALLSPSPSLLPFLFSHSICWQFELKTKLFLLLLPRPPPVCVLCLSVLSPLPPPLCPTLFPPFGGIIASEHRVLLL
jgi:hypothetical protein